MDYSKKITNILRQSSRPVEDINKLINNEVKTSIISYSDWIRYDDEIFGDFGMNKISTDKLYNRFIDETKP